jgi:SAM-dependent methyltransferase
MSTPSQLSPVPKDPEAVKAAVREGYATALSRALAGSSGCCGSDTGCGPSATAIPDPGWAKAGSLADHLGYEPDALAKLPAGAVSSAFGCGNPLAFAEVMPGQTVVDIGSGAGIDCLIAASRVGPEGRVIGVDMTPEMIDRARVHAAEAGATNVEFRLGDAEKMPVDDASADWVMSNCVINLAPDKPAVFREVARVLRPGGRMTVSDIVLTDALPQKVAEDMYAYVGCIAGAVLETDYLDAVRQAGLTEVTITERMPYDLSADGCCGAPAKADEAGIWSIRVTARKPA